VSGEPSALFVNRAGKIVGTDPVNLEVSLESAQRGTHQVSRTNQTFNPFIGDSPEPFAYPFVEVFFWIVPTKFNTTKQCDNYREIFKFIHWALFDPFARNRIIEEGFGPLGTDLQSLALTRLESIQCNGVYIARAQDERTTDVAIYVSIILVIIILIIVLLLSFMHTYYFRSSRIHVSYSLVLILGSIVTLTAPLFWFSTPNTPGVCLGRVWFTSLGFVILLASMFSRTWQLRTIYKLDKSKRIGEIRQLKPVANAILKLVYALVTFVVVDIILLTIWSSVDPYSPEFVVVDDTALLGLWQCHSDRTAVWMSFQILLLSGMIIFGIVVIYQTWTFSNQNVVLETRWVLMALYNIILVLVSSIPFLTLSNLNDSTLSKAMGVAIDLSALGIIFAVLLPRVVKNLLYGSSSGSHHSDGKPASTQTGKDSKETSDKFKGKAPYNSKFSTTEPLCVTADTNAGTMDNSIEMSCLPVSPSANTFPVPTILEQSTRELLAEAEHQPQTLNLTGLRGTSRLEGPENDATEVPTIMIEVVNETIDASQGSPIFNPFT